MSAIDQGILAARRIAGRVRGMINRAVVTRVRETSEARGLQVEVMQGEVDDWIEQLEPYGITGAPEEGAEAIVLHVGGSRSNRIAIVVQQRSRRPTDLQTFDVCVYDGRGGEVRLEQSDPADSATHKVIVKTPGTVELGDGATLGVARLTDSVTSGTGDDAAYWTWIAAMGTAMGQVATYVNAIAPGTVTPPGAAPTTLTGQIAAASAVVKAVD